MENKKEFENYILKLYNEGMKSSEIAKLLNVPARITFRILKKYGKTGKQKELNKIASEKLKKNLNDLPFNKIKNLYLNDLKTLTEIAKCYKTHPKNIKNLLINNGIKLLTLHERTNIKNSILYMNIKNLYVCGKSIPEISKILDISKSNINRVLKMFGVIRSNDKHSLGISYDEYLENLPYFKKYRIIVNNITNSQNLESLPDFEKRGNYKNKNAYHLDHKYSISEGFKNNINPEIIGSIKNLIFIPFIDNLKKYNKCSINLEDLLNDIKKSGSEIQLNWI